VKTVPREVVTRNVPRRMKVLREPRIIAAHRQAHRIYPGMIPLCSRFDSMLFTPKRSAVATFGYFSRFP
jgi:hypothetical protein